MFRCWLSVIYTTMTTSYFTESMKETQNLITMTHAFRLTDNQNTRKSNSLWKNNSKTGLVFIVNCFPLKYIFLVREWKTVNIHLGFTFKFWSVPAWGGHCSWWSWERDWSRSLPPRPAERAGALYRIPVALQDVVNPQSQWCPLCSCALSLHLYHGKKKRNRGSSKWYLYRTLSLEYCGEIKVTPENPESLSDSAREPPDFSIWGLLAAFEWPSTFRLVLIFLPAGSYWQCHHHN